jgi:hypothetical protein
MVHYGATITGLLTPHGYGDYDFFIRVQPGGSALHQLDGTNSDAVEMIAFGQRCFEKLP